MDILSESNSSVETRRWFFIIMFWLVIFYVFLGGSEIFSTFSIMLLLSLTGIYLSLTPFLFSWIILRIILRRFLDKENQRPKFYHFICSLILSTVLLVGIYFLFFQQIFKEGFDSDKFLYTLYMMLFVGLYALPAALFVMFIKLTSKILKVESPAFWRNTLSPALINFFLSMLSLSVISVLTALIFDYVIKK